MQDTILLRMYKIFIYNMQNLELGLERYEYFKKLESAKKVEENSSAKIVLCRPAKRHLVR